jgi:hypothetical protein
MRTVLLRFDSSATEADVTQFLDEESVREPRDRARHILDALCNIGTHRLVGRTYRVTPRGDRFRDWLLREMADGGKRPSKAPDAPKPSPSRSNSPRRASAPKAAAPEASVDDRITFVTPNGWVVHLNPFRQKKARGDK